MDSLSEMTMTIHPSLNVSADPAGMDAVSLVSALIGAQTGMMQLAVDAAQQGIDPLANVAAGIGTGLDVSA